MKALEMIKELQKLINRHGDYCIVYDDYGYYEIDNIAFEECRSAKNNNPYGHEEPVFVVH